MLMSQVVRQLMNVRVRNAISVLILGAGLSFISPNSLAIQRYTTLTKQQCTFCHVNMINKLLLTDAGKYYQKHHTFEGYQPKPTGAQHPPSPGQSPDQSQRH